MARPGKAPKSRTKPKPAKAAERVRKHRQKLRAAGLRPVQLWVWDTSRPGFEEEIQRQMKVLANDPQEKRILDEIAAVADLEGWKWE
jgi:Protein  of unknown function (DUF3018)